MNQSSWAVSVGTAVLVRSPFGGCEIKIIDRNGVVLKKFTGKTEAEARTACEACYPATVEAHQAAYEAWQAEQANGVH